MSSKTVIAGFTLVAIMVAACTPAQDDKVVKILGWKNCSWGLSKEESGLEKEVLKLRIVSELTKQQSIMSNLKMWRYAGYGGLFVSSSAILMHWLIQQRLRKSDHYKLAVLNFLQHKSLCEYMGEPVGFANVDLGAKDNFSTSEEAQFNVPLRGSQRTGIMSFQATRDPSSDKNKWTLQKVEVTVTDRPNERVIVPIKFPIYDEKLMKASSEALTEIPPIKSD